MLIISRIRFLVFLKIICHWVWVFFFFVEIVSLLLFSGFCFFLPPFSFVCWIELVGLRMFGCRIGHRWRFDAAVGWVEEGGRPLRPVRPAAA